jgi:urease accessory protein
MVPLVEAIAHLSDLICSVGKGSRTGAITMLRLTSLVLAATLAMLAPALAHTGVGDANGFVHGFTHPINGIDHVLAMVAVGLFAAHLGGRALWLVPLSFVAMMAVSGALGMSGLGLPFVEVGIALSVVALGIALATGFRITATAAMALVGFFAIFHGHAHGAEMPETASGLEYGAAFVLATAALHLLGIGLGLVIGKMSEVSGGRVLRVAGSAMALAGFVILSGYL